MKYPSLAKIPLIITGLTATGKTRLALELAQDFNLQIISADSRQIFQELDIGTGKYSPIQQIQIQDKFVLIDNVRVFGLNLIRPNQSYSAAQFQTYLEQLFCKANFTDSILVGGTGQYIDGFLNPPHTYFVPPHPRLRDHLSRLEKQLTQSTYTALLQSILCNLEPQKYHQLNSSDAQNPRRLQRAIEVCLQPKSDLEPVHSPKHIPIIGLRAPLAWLEGRISDRVDEMYTSGLKTEFEAILKVYGPTIPALQTIGYQEWLAHSELTDAQVLALIKLHTRQYAKRQSTYLKRFPQIKWFDVSLSGYTQAKEYCRNLLQTNTISL
jgi:tRNA dimethylallyltransferase